MESTFIFLTIVIIILTAVNMVLGAKIRKLQQRCSALEFEQRMSRLEIEATNAAADQWSSKYSQAELERIHLESERDQLRSRLMAKQGAGQN